MAEKCARCEITSEKARLYDVIYEGKMGILCERCSIIENIPILKKPDDTQLKASSRNIEVYERMKRLSGYKDPTKPELNLRKERLNELEKNPSLQLPIKQQLNLIDHFHWEIMKNRRRKGLSHKQLAEAIGESEIALEMLEREKLPENSQYLIKKLEQFFQISLRKITEAEAMVIRKQKMTRTKPVLLDENGRELESIPEPLIEKGDIPLYLETQEEKEEVKEIPWYKKILGRKKKVEEADQLIEENKCDETLEEDETREYNQPLGSRYLEYRRREKQSKQSKDIGEPTFKLGENENLDLDKIDLNQVRISELKEIHKKRVVETTKQERKDEQRKIEDRERLIEARKEELRQMREKESRNIDDSLGGAELLGRNKKADEFTKSVEEFDDELV